MATYDDEFISFYVSSSWVVQLYCKEDKKEKYQGKL